MSIDCQKAARCQEGGGGKALGGWSWKIHVCVSEKYLNIFDSWMHLYVRSRYKTFESIEGTQDLH